MISFILYVQVVEASSLEFHCRAITTRAAGPQLDTMKPLLLFLEGKDSSLYFNES